MPPGTVALAPECRRLVTIINYNNDIGDYMEWSGRGWYPPYRRLARAT